MLLHATAEDTIERGPIHEKENGTDHCNKLRVVVTACTSGTITQSFRVFKEVGCCEAEVASKHMDSHSTADINKFKHIKDQHIIQSEEKWFKSSNEHELRESSFSKQRSHWDKESTSTKLATQNSQQINIDFIAEVVMISQQTDPEASEKHTKLDAPARADIVDTNWAPAVGLEEDHEETETDENHNMDVHPHRIEGF